LIRAAALIAGACVVVACVGADGDGPTRRGAADVIGGTAQERVFVRRFLERVDNSGLIDVRLQPLRRPRSFPPLRDRRYMWLSFTVRGSDPVSEVRAEWNALLVAGAARDSWSARSESVRPVAGVGLNIRTQEGKEITEASFPIQPPPKRRIVPATRAEVAEIIAANAAAASMEVESLDFRQPLGVAPIVRASVSDPRRFRTQANYRVGTLFRGLIDPPRIDGFEVEIRSTDGELVQLAVHSRRLYFSTGWVPPKFR
jgi:hypothetical protein